VFVCSLGWRRIEKKRRLSYSWYRDETRSMCFFFFFTFFFFFFFKVFVM
jgi:hypothetical protein